MNPFCRWFLLSILVLAGCRPASTPTTAAPSPKSFAARGVIREVAADRTRAVIRHEEIPGYMPKMTMELTVREPRELDGLAPGDEITFRLVATEETHWIEQLQRVGRADTQAASAPPVARAAVAELKPGDPMPDCELLGEDGRPVRLADFRGRALAFTFIFTRCPLPDFCPRMGRQFAATRQLLLADRSAPTNWQFLSISFDPEFDTPAVLTSYADFVRQGSADRWRFASASLPVLATVGPRLDLMIRREGGSIEHNLRTVVLDPEGRIHRQFDGNDWTPGQLAEAVREAARIQP